MLFALLALGVLSAAPATARDGRVLIGGKPLEASYRFKGGVRYLPIAPVFAALGVPASLDPKRGTGRIESPWAGDVTLDCAQGTLRIDSRVTRMSPPPLYKDGEWYLGTPVLRESFGIVGEVDESADVHLAGLARVSTGPNGLELAAAIPLKPTHFTLTGPARFVLDLPNVILDQRYEAPFPSSEKGYSAIRVGQFAKFPYTARVVYDLTESRFIPSAAKQSGQSLLALGQSGPVKLVPSTSVTFGIAEDGTGLVIRGLHAASASLVRTDARTLTLTFEGAQLAGASHDFEGKKNDPSGIARISVRNASETRIVVTIVTLKEAAAPQVTYDRQQTRALVLFNGAAATQPLAPEPSLTGGLRGKTIVIDAGHGGHDPGAIMEPGMLGPTRLIEKEINLRMAQDLGARLERLGAQVVMTRADDTFIELNARRDLAGSANADLFVSLHGNSFRTIPSPAHISGTEVYYYKASDAPVADLLYRHIAARTGRGGRGHFQANFVVCKHPTVPSVLVEAAYLSNPEEYQLFLDPTHAFEKNVVTGLLEGIDALFAGGLARPALEPRVFSEIVPAFPPEPLGETITHVALEGSGKGTIPSAKPEPINLIEVPATSIDWSTLGVTPTTETTSTIVPLERQYTALPDRGARLNRSDIFKAETTLGQSDALNSPQANRRSALFSLETL